MKELTINSLCRVCLKNSNFYSNIYKDQSNDKILVYELLNDVCVLNISVDDGLPDYICGECLGSIEEFKSFKTQAQKGSSTLLLLRERMKNPVIKQEELYVSGDESTEPFEEFNTEPFIKQETLDISGDEYEEPFNELNLGPIRLKDEMLTVYWDRNGQEELNKSEESDIVSAVELSAASTEDSTQNDMEPLRLESDEEGIDSTEEQFTHLGDVIHPQHMECLKHKRPHCRFNGAVIADASTMDISIDEESIFEESSNIILGVEVEASLNGKADRLEGQRIHPGESMCMTSPLEEDVAITKEKSRGEVRKTGAEGGRGSVETKVVVGERKSFKCYHCGIELMTKRDLIKHMELHGFGTSYECETCGKVLQNNSKYISLCSKHFNCVECSKSVSQNSTHIRQIRSHMGSKPYKCKKCSKAFSCSSKLIRHMRSHTGSKLYKCFECSKCFSQRSNLVTHMRSHTGSKPYKCLECSKRFSQMCNLRTHMKFHAGSKQYPCIVCNKWFSRTSHLTAHTECHMGTFKCRTCFKVFPNKFNLKRHLLVHTKEKCHECHNCRQRFSQKGDL